MLCLEWRQLCQQLWQLLWQQLWQQLWQKLLQQLSSRWSGLNPTTCRFYLYKNQSASCIDKQKSQESSKKLYLSCWQLSKRKVSRLIGVGPSWLIVAISRAATETCYISFLRYNNNIKKSFFSLNYGAMGVVMGHELSHAFDDQVSNLGPLFDDISTSAITIALITKK